MRHGQSQANADGVLAGQSDSPLTEYGVQQAIQEGGQLHKTGQVFDIIYASPLVRAYDTATAVAQAIGYDLNDIVVDERIVERDVGDLEGQSTDLLSRAIHEGGMNVESNEAFSARCREFLEEVMVADKGKRVLVVAHAGVGEMIQLVLHNKDIESFVTDGLAIPNAQVFKLV